VEEEMMEQLDWPADVLKAGHHGSDTSTGRRWLMDTRPKWVVVSCGRNNNYGHPHPATLRRIESVGAEALRTDQLGSLIFVPTPQGFVFQRALSRP
jgi:competence protein ComEC